MDLYNVDFAFPMRNFINCMTHLILGKQTLPMRYLLVLAVAELEISVSLLLVVQIVMYSYFGFGKILAFSFTLFITHRNQTNR